MEKTIRVKFDTALYSPASIRKSMAAYRDVADFFVRESRRSTEVILSHFNDDVSSRLGDEFANYVLFVEGERRREKAAAD